jgi:hypothetical protein
MTVIMTTSGEPPEQTARLIDVQSRQCRPDPRPLRADDDRGAAEYVAGYAEALADQEECPRDCQ